MTAPKLPPCPVCGQQPTFGWSHSVGESPRYGIGCRLFAGHSITLEARTRKSAFDLWRRLAAAREAKP